MTPALIAWRKQWLFGGGSEGRNYGGGGTGAALHRRGYDKGDIRCCKCDRWINLGNAEEAKEVLVSPAGRRLHSRRYCGQWNFNGGSSNFSTVPKHSGGRRRRVDTVKRY